MKKDLNYDGLQEGERRETKKISFARKEAR
jgi:hypothetical protein